MAQTTMTIDEAKDNLAELLVKAAEGEQVEIVRDDGSAFALIQSKQSKGNRRGVVGSMKGEIWMADDFDEIPEGFEPYLPDEKDLISK